MSSKSRTVRSTYWCSSNEGGTQQDVTASYKTSQQVVISDGHEYQLLGRPGVRNIGGPFSSYKTEYSTNSTYLELSNGWRFAKGRPVPAAYIAQAKAADSSATSIMNAVPSASDSDMDVAGASMVSACIPTNPVVDGSTTLAELVSRKPSLPGTQTVNDGKSVSSASGEYLNYEFAIKPTIQDLSDAVTTSMKADKILQQLERDSGRLVRRRFELPSPPPAVSPSVVTTNQYCTMLGGQTPTIYTQKPGTVTETTTTSYRRWFSGAFTYVLPDGAFSRYWAERDKLYGLVPDLNTLYNVIPFSWMADWYTNLGTVVSNLSAFSQDGLVMPYGYVMWETTTTKTYVHHQQLCFGGVWTNHVTTSSVRNVSKRRRPANPFGFGLLDTDLTVRQQAILAALGLNRR